MGESAYALECRASRELFVWLGRTCPPALKAAARAWLDGCAATGALVAQIERQDQETALFRVRLFLCVWMHCSFFFHKE